MLRVIRPGVVTSTVRMRDVRGAQVILPIYFVYGCSVKGRCSERNLPQVLL